MTMQQPFLRSWPLLRRRRAPVVQNCIRLISNTAGDGSGMKIYNSLASNYRTLPHTSTTNKNNNSQLGTAWYVCGPTVYDSAHLGHGRTYVSLDILRRVALNLHSGSGSIMNGGSIITPRPLYVMNITDVDDKIIQRSLKRSREQEKEADPLSLARYYEYEFWQDMDALNVMRPDVICRVSEHVESTIVPYIQQIVDGGMAYVIPEEEDCISENNNNVHQKQQQQGSVYFDVRAFESKTNSRTKYGKLAPDVASTDFFSWESQEDVDEGEPLRKKRDPRDFCLWKYRPRSVSSTKNSSMENRPVIEPESVSYNSPWGPGRPGWHVECSAMIEQLSNDFQYTHEFGIHAGGVDLKFPHHSNEIAQAEAYMSCGSSSTHQNESDFKEWIPHWIHTGHLYVKGRKMSKSLKNFVTIREMLGVESDGTAPKDQNNAWSSPADDFRLWCLGLSGAYRGPATYSIDRMEEARVIREKWVRFLIEGQECLDRWSSSNDCMMDDGTLKNTESSRLWGDEELKMFNTVTQCSMNCRKALLDDLDGTSFVKELTHIAETGMAYVEQAKSDQINHQSSNPPVEPLRFVLDTLRGQLQLVGFTKHTFNAGIAQQEHNSGATSSPNNELVDEAVAFRAAVRSTALSVLRKKKDGLDASNEILNLCDAMRNERFPKLGIEIIDGKVVDDTNSEGDARRGWRHCSPHR